MDKKKILDTLEVVWTFLSIGTFGGCIIYGLELPSDALLYLGCLMLVWNLHICMLAFKRAWKDFGENQ